MKFMLQLCDLNGKFIRGMFVNSVDVPKPALAAAPAHHIIIVDRSGSMYSVMEETKGMIEKIMTIDEFQGAAGLVLTLISYSSRGDCTVHFARQTPQTVMDPRQPYLQAIRNIRATCLTSVSGALVEALNYVKPGETTAVSVHTDGYFNDASPASEARAIETWVQQVGAKYPNIYVNGVAYGYADFKMLDQMTGRLSGRTVTASTVKEVYTALYDTTRLLAGRVVPAIQVAPEADDSFLAYVNLTQKKVNGSTTAFTVRGVGPQDDTLLYRFVEVEPARYAAPSPERKLLTPGKGGLPAYVYARALLAQGRFNEAKYVISGLGDQALLRKHYKALTDAALGAFAADLEARIAGDFADCGPAIFGLGGSSSSILDLCSLLQAHRTGFTLDLPATLRGYSRRSVKKLEGRWEGEKFIPGSTKLVPADDPTCVSVSGFELSNTAATINMRISRSAGLHRNGKPVRTVAGVKLDLLQIRAYTLVGDGEVVLPALHVRISSKQLFARLAEMGWVTGAFDHKQSYVLALSDHPVCDLTRSPRLPTQKEVEWLIEATALASIYRAALGEETGAAQAWTSEQLAELAENDLTPRLNYSPSCQVPYTDRLAAFSAGEVDSRTVFRVTFGTREVAAPSNLGSANAYLGKRYKVFAPPEIPGDRDKDGSLKSPSLRILRMKGVTWEEKALTGRTKLTPVDAVYGVLLGRFIGSGGLYASPEELAARLAEAEQEVENIYAGLLRPLVMYIGSTGLVEAAGAERVDGTKLEERFPGIVCTRKQKEEGTYFLLPDGAVIGVCPESVEYTTEAGLQAIRRLTGNTGNQLEVSFE